MGLRGTDAGRRVCHDAQPGRLDVDFVYPDAKPLPIALEITSLLDAAFLAGGREAFRVQDHLTAVAEREELGSWLAMVNTERRMKDLESRILDLIRKGREIAPGYYTHHDLMPLSAGEQEEFMRLHDELKAMGLVDLRRWPTTRENAVWAGPMTDARVIGGFSSALQATVDANSEKLSDPRLGNYECHLAVRVDRFDFSVGPEETAIPGFPPELQRLWVATSLSMGGGETVWTAGRNETAWSVVEA
jgi:hypothetical protein